MTHARESGLLLHPTSLAGLHGIGDLGPCSHDFVDFLADCRQSVWQVLPLGPTGYGDSPYQAFSAFAGNPLLVSLELLQHDGLLGAETLSEGRQLSTHRVDFGAVVPFRWGCLKKAHLCFERDADATQRRRLDDFCSQQARWLDDFALFSAIKSEQGGRAWTSWPADVRDRHSGAVDRWRETHLREFELQRFAQYLFWHQWAALHQHAADSGIDILGDVPIFVAHDSADVWARPDLFALDDSGQPEVVAGVPPDYFSAEGQLWGNPLYRWDRLADDDYDWWVQRLRWQLQGVDRIRLDHFRGFEAYWEIPAAAPNAIAGRWVKGPGADLFKTLQRELGSLPLVAEDLGLITPEVTALRQSFDLPGMVVLHFAFGGDADNVYLPHNVQENSVIYTGTHDNDTTRGWYDGVDDKLRHHLRCYLGCDGNDIAWDLIRAALRSVARVAIIPVQDLLGLGSNGRMNTPAQAGGNWDWRLQAGELDESLAHRLRELTLLFGRTRDTPNEVSAVNVVAAQVQT